MACDLELTRQYNGQLVQPFLSAPDYFTFTAQRMPRARAFSFTGSDEDYILFLEDLAMRNSVMSVPSPGSSAAQSGGHLQMHGSRLAFIIEDPSLNDVGEAQWIGKATRLISETPTAAQWWTSLKDRKLESLTTNCTIITSILRGATADLAPPIRQSGGDIPADILSRITDYAMYIRQFRDIAKIVQTMHKFIFVCLCVVAISEGIHEADVNRVMILVVTRGQDKYLSRIRKGARWVNTLIDELNGRGWQNRASELLLLWNKFPTYYSDFADYWDVSMNLLRSNLSTTEYTTAFEAKPGWTDIFIPSIVHELLGKSVGTAKISAALGYRNSHVLESDGCVTLPHPWEFFSRRDETS